MRVVVAVGDHVVTLFSPQCRECVHCLDPRTNLCLAIREQQGLGFLPDGTTRLSRDGEPVRHFMGTLDLRRSTRSCPRSRSRRCRPEAPLDRACLFACGLSTGLGAAMNTARVEPGSTCVVFGAGMVGLGAVAGCRLQGAERIVCVDLSEERLELARGQGATETLDRRARHGRADARADGRLRRRLHLRGDRPRRGDARRRSSRRAWAGASATVCGVAGKGEALEVVPRFLITGRRVAGSSFGGVKGRDQVPQLVDRWLAGEIDVEPFVSHRLTLDEVNRGFELMEAQDGIRSVIAFG